MNLILLMYIFGSAVLVTGGAFSFFSSGQQITAGIFFVGMLTVVIYFGFRWFGASGLSASAKGPWPPVVNYCPDFLTLSTINGEKVCIDTIGVAQAGGIAVWSDPTQTDERYLFHLFLNNSGSERVSKLCAQAAAKKVSWEGVWDGSVCMGVEPPAPPAS
jgi:hypothetical protein